MKYYIGKISVTLAEKLKEKGMPITYSNHPHQIAPDVKGIVMGNFKEIDCPSYAEVFDWLMENNIIILNAPCYNTKEDKIVGWIASVDLANKVLGEDFTFGFEYEEHLSWHEAAEAAIEKALTLI